MKRQTAEEYTREVVERRRMTEKKDRRCGNCERYICVNVRQQVGECLVYTKAVTETEKPCTNWKYCKLANEEDIEKYRKR